MKSTMPTFGRALVGFMLFVKLANAGLHGIQRKAASVNTAKKPVSFYNTQAHFTLRVRANVQPKSSIPIGAKVEISPKGFTLGVKADIEKNFSICPKFIINDEHQGPALATKLKKGSHQICEASLQPKNGQSWSPSFLVLTPSVKQACGPYV